METAKRHNSSLKQENNTLQTQLKARDEENNVLRIKIAKLNKEINLGNLHGLNEEQLKELEVRMTNNIKKMTENITKIRERKEELNQDKSLCMLCCQNKKCIVIQGCNHLDICEQCKNNLPRKKCPRCQSPFKKTIKVNYLNL